MKQRIIFLLLAAICFGRAVALDISGRAVDAAGEPLISASVRLLKGPDSTLVKGVVTDNAGKFVFRGLSRGKYIVEVSYVGCTTAFADATVAAANVALPDVVLSENSIALRETVVTGIRTPITVKEDTIEYNAEAYRTPPGAAVEELLKRLPGVEVGSDGTITANGQQVTKILIDGKEFFSDDPTVASRNLPVNMVQSLQVVNRKSDLARLTGVDDGEDETVINLTVKKDMHNGWFGNFEAGYGSDSRYGVKFNVNRFVNGNQFTFLGAANNINDLSFNDGTASRFRRFGGNNGITTSQALGVNFNVGRGEILRVGGDVMYTRSVRDTRRSSTRQYLLESFSPYYMSGREAGDRGNNVRADFRMEWKPDTLTTLDFRPNFSYNHNNSWAVDSSLTAGAPDGSDPVTRSLNRNASRGTSWEAGGRLIFNRKFASRRGRAISLFVNYRFSDVREYESSYSWNKFFQADDSVDLYDQWTDNHTWTNNISARVSWTEPLGNPAKGNFLTFAYRFQYRWNNADKLVYDHPVTFPDGWDGEPVISPEDVFNDNLSNRFRNDYMNQDIRAGFKHVSRLHNIDVGLSLVPQSTRSIDLINSERNIPRRLVWNYAPYLRYRWRKSKTQALQIDYMGRSSQPTIAQLQPVADMSDPLNIVIGNPDLDPSFTHNLRLRFHNFNRDAQRSVMLMMDARLVQNSIVSKTTYDPTTGGRVTEYTNVNGVWNVRAMNMVSFPFRDKAWTFNNHTMLYYSNAVGFNNGRRNRSGSFNFNISPGIAWRPDYVELELRPRYSLQTVHNTVSTAADRTVHSYGGQLYAAYNAPFGLLLNSDLSYTATRGYTEGYDENRWMWNASIGYQFLKDRALTLSLKAYDILAQQSSISRNVTANYIEDVMNNTLGRYVMFSVVYKFNTFGKGATPERRESFGPGGGHPGPPPGAPRPPMGGRPF